MQYRSYSTKDTFENVIYMKNLSNMTHNQVGMNVNYKSIFVVFHERCPSHTCLFLVSKGAINLCDNFVLDI